MEPIGANLLLGACKLLKRWSGRPDSNRRRPAWEAGILPAELLPLVGLLQVSQNQPIQGKSIFATLGIQILPLENHAICFQCNHMVSARFTPKLDSKASNLVQPLGSRSVEDQRCLRSGGAWPVTASLVLGYFVAVRPSGVRTSRRAPARTMPSLRFSWHLPYVSWFARDRRPVTSEVAGSSPVVPAICFQRLNGGFFRHTFAQEWLCAVGVH